MSVTADKDVPAEVTDLFQAFNRCAGGHDTTTVVRVAVNFLVAAVNHHTGSEEAAAVLAASISQQLPNLVSSQWNRLPSPDDREVPIDGH